MEDNKRRGTREFPSCGVKAELKDRAGERDDDDDEEEGRPVKQWTESSCGLEKNVDK